ncbi:MAG: hypothetical protein JW929_14400 [Anaerolineales bacterium]|nr:hypothetical protein [Anaerolineales bacterium]
MLRSLIRSLLRRAMYAVTYLPAMLALTIALTSDSFAPRSLIDKVRVITAPYEFEFVSWTANAVWEKLLQFTLGDERYLSADAWHDIVLEYNALLDGIFADNAELTRIFSDPSIPDPMRASTDLRGRLEEKRSLQARRQNLVEAILQEQVSSELRAEGFAYGGEMLPPVLFRFTQLPMGLIISPRHVIRQDANVQLAAGLTLERQIALEAEAERRLGVSALVVPFGGLGTFPTMIMETTYTQWVLEAVTHEWTHHYLYLHPLGIAYDSSAEMRTINETVATLFGKAIGAQVVRRHYPEWAGGIPNGSGAKMLLHGFPAPRQQEFDYQHEMYVTRVETDRLLAEGKIAEAEAYMEARRRFIVENGYVIRRLNQAFFAFYGSYADSPGERGEDPVGPAVVALYEQCPSAGAFLRYVAQVTSFEHLQQLAADGRCG